MIDKLNPMNGDDHGDDSHDMGDEEETDEERMYSNSGNNPKNVPPSSKDAMVNSGNQNHDQSGPADAGDRMDGNMPKATMEQQLMSDYKKFVAETQVDEISDVLANRSFNKRQANYDAAKNKHGDNEFGPANNARLKYLGNQDKQTNRIRKNDATGPNATGQMGSIKTRAQAAPDPYRNSSGSM
jgi:hypothetical protein